MRQLVCSTLAAAILAAGGAHAAPLAAYDWSGAYLGAFAGAAFGQSDVATSVDCTVSGVLCDPTPHYPENGLLIGATAGGKARSSGFTGGGFVGYNWQNREVVFGFEADLGAMPLYQAVGGSAATLNLGLYNGGAWDSGGHPAIFSTTATATADWLATVRGRIGFLAHPGVLLYGTAGVAATELTVSNAYADDFNNGTGTGNREASSTSALRTALVVGAGAEWAMAGHWRVRAEYLHTSFGPLATTGISTFLPEIPLSNPITSTADLSTDIVRVGVAYGF